MCVVIPLCRGLSAAPGGFFADSAVSAPTFQFLFVSSRLRALRSFEGGGVARHSLERPQVISLGDDPQGIGSKKQVVSRRMTYAAHTRTAKWPDDLQF